MDRVSNCPSPSKPCALIVVKNGRSPFVVATRCASKVGAVVGNAHDAAQDQAGQPCHGLGQRRGLVRAHARLGGAAVHVHLYAHHERRQVRGALLGQPLRDLEPVHRLRPVEMLGHQPRLVALYRADAMPLQRERGRQGAQRGHFLHGLLDVVLAEGALPRQGRGVHGLGAEGLGHRQQRHGPGRPARGGAGLRDALVHALEVSVNRRHNV